MFRRGNPFVRAQEETSSTRRAEKRALETVKVQTAGRIISRARLRSLLNPNA